MSELLNARRGRNNFRRQLLTTVSALALLGSVWKAQDAKADGDTERPTLWIELGGQLEQQTGQGDPYSPSFVSNNPASPVVTSVSPLHFEKSPLFSNGAEGKLTFEPADTDWVFSAGVRYGRSAGHKKFFKSHQITHVAHVSYMSYQGRTPTSSRGIFKPAYGTRQQVITQFAGAQIEQKQTHAIVDFAAGRDFGLGMFGKDGTSDLNVGVRFAQFVSRTSGSVQMRPDGQFFAFCPTYVTPSVVSRYPNWKGGCGGGNGFHSYAATFQSRRSFHGIGPALSWNASVPVLGERQAGTLNIEWGANAALLFGRQRANGSHHSSGYYKLFTAPTSKHSTHSTVVGNFNRSRTVTVPNVGGFAGVSFNFTTVKVSMGYRGDFFFGAMDTGNDTRKTKTVGFYGPFASVSIGIGG